MDSIFGIQGPDFVIVACDGSVAFSILKIKENEDKIVELDERKIMGVSGEGADRNSFSEFIQKNLSLIKYKTGNQLGMSESANYIRHQYAEALRSRNGPHQCNALLAGIDQDGAPSLYWIDYLGSLQKITRGAHGYAAHFVLGLLDNQYKKVLIFNIQNLTKEEGVEIMKKCVHELKTRMLISQNVFIAKIVTRDGIERIQL